MMRLHRMNRRALGAVAADKVDMETSATKLGFASLVEAVKAIDRRCKGRLTEKEARRVLSLANVLVDGHGVVSFVQDDRTKVVYVNVGDPYTLTVLWCGIRERIYVCTFADWLDLRERWHRSEVDNLQAA